MVGTIQNSIGSIPVLANDPPPEGTMAAEIQFQLTSVEPSLTTSLQLNSQAGIRLSQVVTLAIDNTLNGYAVQITHGVFNETTIVPAYGSVIIPTFSSQGGNYTILVSAVLPDGEMLSSDLFVTVICMNYARTPGSFGNMTVSSILGANQNVSVLSSGATGLDGVGGGTIAISLADIGNYIISSIDFNFAYASAAAAGSSGMDIAILSSTTITNTIGPDSLIVAANGYLITATNSNVVPGTAFSTPVSITFNQGLLLPRGRYLVLANISSRNILPIASGGGVGVNFNIFGVSTP